MGPDCQNQQKESDSRLAFRDLIHLWIGENIVEKKASQPNHNFIICCDQTISVQYIQGEIYND